MFEEIERPKISFSRGKTILAVIIIIALIVFSLVIIQPGYVGVVYSAWGGLDFKNFRQPGWSFRFPLLQTIYPILIARDTVNMYDVSWQECQRDPECDDIAVQVPSKEGLTITVDVSVFFKVKEAEAANIIQRLTENYRSKTIMPLIRSSVRDVAGGMAVTEIYGPGRQLLETEIFKELHPLFDKDGFILEDVLVRDVGIPREIEDAIKSKQTTEQEFLQKEFELKKEELEKQRKIIEAEGNAEAIKIKGESLRLNPEVLQWEAIQKWNGILPLATSGLPFINIPIDQTNPYTIWKATK